MTAISKAFVTLTDAATDVDSPIDQALIQGLRDNTVHLREWLGASYYAGAQQNHSHDGVDSALVEIGPNYLRNGSFEQGTNGWTITNFTGGSNALNTANDMDGAQALAITSTVLANGGAEAFSNEYIPITGGEGIDFKFAIKASVANISAKAEAFWYDDAKAQISVSTLYTTTNAPTALTGLVRGAAAPGNARFVRIKLTGGVPAIGAATGTIYFDGCRLSKCDWAEPGIYMTSPSISGVTQTNTPVKKGEIVASKSGTYRVFLSLRSDDGNNAFGRIYKNGVAFGTTRSAGPSGNSWSEDLFFNKGDLVQMYLWHTGTANCNGTFALQESTPTFGNGAAV